MTESPHPTDDQLSAAIDGADADALAHASACDRCGPRLALMQEVAGQIGTPPPVDELLRERVIAAALAAPVGGAGDVTPAGGGRRRPPLAWMAGAAAVLLVVLVAGAVLVNRGDRDRSFLTSGDSGDSAEVESPATGQGQPNLGSFNDAQQLGAVVGPLIGEDTIGPAQPTAGEGGGGTGGGANLESAPTTTTAPAPSRRPLALRTGPCSDTVEREYGQGLGPLVYTAALTWQNAPAVLLAYRIEGAEGPLDHRVFVLAERTCTLLTVLSL